MSKTFAQHILGRAAAGAHSLPSAERAQANANCRNRSASTATPTTTPATTYASVVLVMAMGVSTAAAAADRPAVQASVSSSAQTRISLTIPERIEARGLDQLVASSVAGHDALAVGEASGCIFGHGSGRYNLAVVGAVEGDQPYTLSYAANDEALQQVRNKSTGFAGAGALGCARGEANARLKVTRAQPATAGQALTLLISPE